MLKLTIAFLLLVNIQSFAIAAGPHKYIKYYEALNYDRFHIQKQHERVKRSTNSTGGAPGHVILAFHSHGGHFNIRLVQDDTIFHTDLELVDGKGNPIDHDHISHIYHGTIYGKKKSLVHGSIIHGVFTGVIKDPDRGTYYVEEAGAFFEGKSHLFRQTGHSIIYHGRDIDYPHEFGPHKTCGASFSDIEKHMTKVQKSAVFKDEEHQALRKKRAISAEKNTCLLFIRTDHMLFSEMQTREKVISKIAEHVKALNDMYNPTTFDRTSDGTVIRNIGFMVKRMMINEETDVNDIFHSSNIGVEKFLELASSSNHNDYCLAYVFTQRDFDNGVLGLAWVGGVGSSGGICDEYRQYEGKTGKSLNTGIVTFENYGTTVPSRVSHITFAHEVGHNFGSPHDSGIQCTPEASGIFKTVGNYIMYASATSGEKENNRLFSGCSIGNMSRVLEHKKDRCFVESDLPICGNAIVDDKEECDCGYEDQCEEVKDNCCYPADNKEKGCTLKPEAKCSITEGPCCDPVTCGFYGSEQECSPDAECQFSQTCDSKSASCPHAPPKTNRTTECNYGTQVCWSGECSGSVCQKHELEECSCDVPEKGDTGVACHVCCQPKGMPGECKSTGDNETYGDLFNGQAILLQPGSPCDDFKGYCDMFSKCRKVDADGPLSRLKKAILNPELYRTIKEWIVQYWWAVALMCLALIMLMAGFIKLCSVHTPSNNPKLKKHKSLPGANTLRRRRQAQQQRRQQSRTQHPQQMREMRRH